MSDSADYIPISCDLHSRFELAVMRGLPLQLAWKDIDGTARQQQVLPLDLFTRTGEEFLVVGVAGKRLEIRLDRIQKLALEATV